MTALLFVAASICWGACFYYMRRNLYVGSALPAILWAQGGVAFLVAGVTRMMIP